MLPVLRLPLLCAALFLLAACGTGATATPTAVVPATEVPTIVAAQPVNYRDLPQSKTAEGYAVLGDPAAPVTLTMFSDFLGTACAFHVLEVEPQIVQDFVRDGRVKIVYRHLVQIDQASLVAGEASECAGDQGQLWEMREALYAAQNDVAADARRVAERIADGLGLDVAAFSACNGRRPLPGRRAGRPRCCHRCWGARAPSLRH
ncbi:thioredoxin domain-containing protein [Candidatus Gracilibacteria bacterium]|nr:thioredoxin domain-containing protein [Candidatus Gracilibacteria bacterium]